MGTKTFRFKTRHVVGYFVLAYALSWSIAIPLALANQDVMPPVLPPWAHYFVAFGPALSALTITWISEGTSGLRDLASRIAMWNVHPLWWAVALSPLILGFVVILILNTVTESAIRLPDLGDVHFLPPLGLGALVFWILTFGIGEEIGWRGYALPRLQRGRSAFLATIILATFWALWHLPTFFYLYDPSIAMGWLVGLFAGAIVFTWLFNSSGGSILIVATWHGCFNFITSSDAGGGILAAVVSTIVMIWAVLVVMIFGPATLSHANKCVGSDPSSL